MFKGRHFDQSVILLCVRWYLASNLGLRDLEERMAERDLSIDHSTVHHWVVHVSPQLLEYFHQRKRPVAGKGTLTKPTSRCVANGCISTVPSTVLATRSSSSSANTVTCRLQSVSFERRLHAMAARIASPSTAVRQNTRQLLPAILKTAFATGRDIHRNQFPSARASISITE